MKKMSLRREEMMMIKVALIQMMMKMRARMKMRMKMRMTTKINQLERRKPQRNFSLQM